MLAVRQLHRARGRQLAEALRSMPPELPPEKFQFHGWEQAEDEAKDEGVSLVDIWRVAPQSKFNLRLMMELYAGDTIPEEEYMTHMLDAKGPDHKAIMVRQKCFSIGLGSNMFPEQFVHRYF